MSKVYTVKRKEDRYWGNYRGEVVAVDDPLKACRARVRIPPAFTEVPKDDIPWAVTAAPLFFGVGQDQGVIAVPPVGSWVWCFFENGDIYQPVYFASAPAMENNVPDGPLRGRGETDDIADDMEATKIDAGDWSEPSVPVGTVYPKSTVAKNSGGFLFEMDETPGDRKLVIRHPSGSRIVMNEDGDIILHAAGDLYSLAEADSYEYAGASRQTKIEASDTTKAVDITSEASATNNVTGVAGINVTSSGVLALQVASISFFGGSATIAGPITLNITDALNITATAMNFNSGTKGVARIDDATGPQIGGAPAHYHLIQGGSSTILMG